MFISIQLPEMHGPAGMVKLYSLFVRIMWKIVVRNVRW